MHRSGSGVLDRHRRDCTIDAIPAGRTLLESPRSITLAAHQSLLLARDARDAEGLKLTVHEGIGRIAASFTQPGGRRWTDVTLAFAAREEIPWLRLPASTSCLLEAQTPLRCDLQPLAHCPASHDLIGDWLLELHLVRHPVGADLRLRALLQLLVQRFGRRSAAGYHLPLALGHARLAELIGSTRSTVTRQISQLRQRNQLQPLGGGDALLLHPALVEDAWAGNLDPARSTVGGSARPAHAGFDNHSHP